MLPLVFVDNAVTFLLEGGSRGLNLCGSIFRILFASEPSTYVKFLLHLFRIAAYSVLYVLAVVLEVDDSLLLHISMLLVLP